MMSTAIAVIVGLLPVFLFGMLVAWMIRPHRGRPFRCNSVCGGEIIVFIDGTTLICRAGSVRVLYAPVPPAGYDDGGF